MEFLLILLVLVAVLLVVSSPWRRPAGARAAARQQELADLEAEKEAKYGEIREAELDRRTGRLSEEDWRALDGDLRAEAVEILRRIDAAGGDAEPSA